jgi:hypothetical protein
MASRMQVHKAFKMGKTDDLSLMKSFKRGEGGTAVFMLLVLLVLNCGALP